MNRRVAIWGVLILIHVTFGLLSIVLHNDRLGAITAGSVYLPLIPFDSLGLPVFRRDYVTSITPTGWVTVVLFWLAVYWGIASVLARLVPQTRRPQ